MHTVVILSAFHSSCINLIRDRSHPRSVRDNILIETFTFN